MRDAQAFTPQLGRPTRDVRRRSDVPGPIRAVIDDDKKNRYTQPSLTGVSPFFNRR